MIELNYGNDTFNVRSVSSEITVNELQKIINELNEDKAFFFDTWLNIIEMLSDKKGVKDLIDDTAFYKVIKNISITKVGDIKSEFVFKERTFNANITPEGKLSIKAIQLANIERIVKKSPNKWIAKAMAVVFEEEGVSNTESNINKRAALFGDKMSAELCIPLLLTVNAKLITNIDKIKKLYEQEA